MPEEVEPMAEEAQPMPEEAEPSQPKARPPNNPKRAVAEYLDKRLGPLPASDDPSAAPPEDPDRAEIRRSLVSALTAIVGDAGVCVKADTQYGSPVLVAVREGTLWLVSHVPSKDSKHLGSVEAQRLGSLPAAEIVQTTPIPSRAEGRRTIELRHERLPGGSLSFDTGRLRRDAADELLTELGTVAR
jgi:hypothetical protein